MTDKISDTAFVHALQGLEQSNVKIGSLGGRYVELNGQRWTMNAIVQHFNKWTTCTQDAVIKRTLLDKLFQIDAVHPEKRSSFFIRLLTCIRQFFGNLFYDRHKILKCLETALPQKLPPATRTDTLPPIKRTESVVAADAVAFFDNRPLLAEEDYEPFALSVLFPAVDFFQVKKECLFDKLLLVAGFQDEKERRMIKIRVHFNYYKDLPFKDLPSLLNQSNVVKYLKEALIHVRASDKSAIIEFVLPHLSPSSINLILGGYCHHYNLPGKEIMRLDTTLQDLIKYYVALVSTNGKKEQGKQIKHTLIINGFALLIPTDTKGLDWMETQLDTLRKEQLLTHGDITTLLNICRLTHQEYWGLTVYQCLFKMLPPILQESYIPKSS